MRRIVNDETGHPKEMELFACAILKTTVEGYRAMLHRAGFRLRVLTVTECAYGAVLGAYLRRMGAENDDKDRCIVSIGHRSTHLYIYHGATFDSRREIDVGGRLIDEQIAEHCGVDIHLAHSYMRSDYNGVLEADYAREAYSRLAVEIMKASAVVAAASSRCCAPSSKRRGSRSIRSPSCSRSSFRPRSRGRICVPSAV